MTGIKASEIVGKRVLEALPQTEQYWIDLYGKVALTGEPIQFENYHQGLDRYYSVSSYAPIPGQFVAIFMDVTDRRRAEEALQDKNRELDLYFNTVLDLLCIADTDGYFRRMNPQWKELLGWELDELEGHNFYDFIHPDDVEKTRNAVENSALKKRY
jgi:PAS domain-containing protein